MKRSLKKIAGLEGGGHRRITPFYLSQGGRWSFRRTVLKQSVLAQVFSMMSFSRGAFAVGSKVFFFCIRRTAKNKISRQVKQSAHQTLIFCVKS